MKAVIDSLSSTPKLIIGTVTSFFGAATGEAAKTPTLQTVVWVASAFAAIATGSLALYRLYSEYTDRKNKRKETK